MKRGPAGNNISGGANKGLLQCRVQLLNGSDYLLDVNKKSNAQSTFDQVLRQLGIVEKDYFGLEYEDEHKNQQWVDLQKPLKKQIKKSPFRVLFRVRYYPLDPMVPHVSCRNQFYQQLKKDIADGILKCPIQTSPCVISYILQADLGDYEDVSKDVEYLKEMKLLSTESMDLHEEISRFHQLYQGMNVLEAVNGFLRKVRELDTYGIQLYDICYEETNCQFGISPGGITIFRRNRSILFKDWSFIAEVSFKNKKFSVLITEPGVLDTTLVFEMESLKVCKDLWKISAEFASFYSEPNRRVREDPENIRSPDKFSLPRTPLKTSQEDSPESAESKPQRTKSLPHKLPDYNPNTNALTQQRSEGRGFCDTPTSPGDFTSLSTSTSENLSPLVPFSPRDENNDVFTVPEIPNLHDEEGLPLDHHGQQAPPPIKKEPRYKYQGYKMHVMENNDHGHQEMKVQNSTNVADHVSSIATSNEGPPGLPPRNYNSQYRLRFHSASGQLQSSPRHTMSSPRHTIHHSEQGSSSNVGDLSQDMGGSLLDLADELGGENSPVSSSGRWSQTEMGGASGYSKDMRRGKYSSQVHSNSRTLPSSFHSSNATHPDLSPPAAEFPPRISSPHLPDSSTKGHVHNGQNTSGRSLVKTWVQEQQLRAYQSSPSEHSLDGANSPEQSSSSHSHHLPLSPDTKHLQYNQGSLSTPEAKVSQLSQGQGSTRSSGSLPHSSSSLKRERDDTDQERMQQNFEGKDGWLDHKDSYGFFVGNHHGYQQQNDRDVNRYPVRSHSYQTRSHDHQQRSHDHHQMPQDNHRFYQRSHEHHQKSPDHHQVSHDQYHRSQAKHAPKQLHQQQHGQMQESESAQETNEFPLPNSPAPPPYKSPSPDSERAQVILGLRQPPTHLDPSPRHSSAFKGPIDSGGKQYENQDDKQHGNQDELPPRSKTPDLLRELEEIMGGVEAMVSEATAESSKRVGANQISSEELKPEQGMCHLQDMKAKTANSSFGEVLKSKTIQNIQTSQPETQQKSNKKDLHGVKLVVQGPSSDVAENFEASHNAQEMQKRMKNSKIQQNVLHHHALIRDDQKLDESKHGRSITKNTKETTSANLKTNRDNALAVGSKSGGHKISNPEVLVHVSSPSSYKNEHHADVMNSPQRKPEAFADDDNLADILQEVMSSDNLPPPPAHLMALSQELESQGQGYRDEFENEPLDISPVAPPPKVASSLTSKDEGKIFLRQQDEKLRNDGRSGPKSKGKYDPKMFSRQKVELPLSNDNTTQSSTSSHLPPEIANFMNRVRNFSADGADNQTLQNLSQHSDSSNRKHLNDRDIPSHMSEHRDAPKESVVYDSLSKVKITESVLEASNSQSVERVNITDDNYRETDREREHRERHALTKKTGPNFDGLPQTVHANSYHSKHQVSQVHNYENHSKQMNEFRKPGSPSEEFQLPPSHQHRPKAFSLPRGQMPNDVHHQYHLHQQNDSNSSHGSTPTTPQAQSDLTVPVYPQGVERGRYHGGNLLRSPSSPRQQHWPIESSNVEGFFGHRGYKVREREHQQFQFPTDRRAQTFSSGNRRQQQHISSYREPLPSSTALSDDSLPTSPSVFTQHQHKERKVQSPQTQMENRSFQAHLKSLDMQEKMRKFKVLDWIQRSNNEAWDRENVKKERDNFQRLELDPMTHLPSRPYNKQEPVYATADDVTNFAPESNYRIRNSSSGSMPSQRDQKMDPRSRMESHPRMETFPNNTQRQYHPATRPHSGSRGRERGQHQRSDPQQPPVYPTARFGKNYYVLDV